MLINVVLKHKHEFIILNFESDNRRIGYPSNRTWFSRQRLDASNVRESEKACIFKCYLLYIIMDKGKKDQITPMLITPVENRSNSKGKRRGPDQRLIEEFEKAHDKGLTLPELRQCEPQGNNGKKLETQLRVLGVELKEAACEDPALTASVGTTDKARQTPINRLGTEEGAGNKAMEAYWHAIAEMMALVGAINPAASIRLHLARVAPGSDEGNLVIAGSGLTKDIGPQFEAAWKVATERVRARLKEYRYQLMAGKGSEQELFELNLQAFSKILRDPERIVSLHYSLSEPFSVGPGMRPDFLLHAIRMLENKEIRFLEHLPRSFDGRGGLAEVRSPFEESLQSRGIASRERGSFVEIKLTPQNMDDARALLQFISDGWGVRYGLKGTIGTRKGFAEAYSGRFGIRGFNTFLGKAGANRFLTPITHALLDVENGVVGPGAEVIPISTSYLQYWVDLPPDEARLLVKAAIEERVHGGRSDDVTRADLMFNPSLIVLEASQTRVADVRARFILASLERGRDPAERLAQTDFLVNFIENVGKTVQDETYEKLGLNSQDRANIETIAKICKVRRTIRDTEDLVWILRGDERILQEIKGKAGELENWVFSFAAARFDEMFLQLARIIKSKVEN